MNESEFTILHYQYSKEPDTLTRNQLYQLIDHLFKTKDQLMETIDDISQNRDNEDKEPFSNYKEDLD